MFMAQTMVRTQVYLPREVYEKLRQRAEKHKLTLALQIRAALEDYLDRVEAEDDDGILHADDPIFKMIGMYSSGVTDASVNHDYYLYGAPKREPDQATVKAVRQKRSAAYRAKSKRRSRKRGS
jgi:hypothetical protein